MFSNPDPQFGCWMVLLICQAIGVVIGVAAGFTDFTGYHRYGSVNAVIEARYYSEHPPQAPSSPAIPRGMLFAILLSVYAILRNECPGFLPQHLPYFCGLVACGVSVGWWLLLDFNFAQSVKQQRKIRIDAFMADPNAPVPAQVTNPAPPWMSTWNLLNIVLFVLLAANVVSELIA
jgi:hypothetical protein